MEIIDSMDGRLDYASKCAHHSQTEGRNLPAGEQEKPVVATAKSSSERIALVQTGGYSTAARIQRPYHSPRQAKQPSTGGRATPASMGAPRSRVANPGEKCPP
ncbi:hypothetical protein Bxe_B0051 [Paraburkholderia xenovorans LB400]|uniref:Uncharacterized protein n=1 Tax=Paraburkholderia xenovorans (strain LB400) TaxID=266265 RepID=Q13J64_PARXL|nr:hypothetical protein Bxe_B0051 [Paraburkholderia xenovorans LB400]